MSQTNYSIGNKKPVKVENGFVTFKAADVEDIKKEFMYLRLVQLAAKEYSKYPLSGITQDKIKKRTDLRQAIESFELFFNGEVPF